MNSNIEIAAPTEEDVMSSTDLLTIINGYRNEEGSKDKKHSNFMRDIKNILGVGALRFESSYLSVQNKQLTCYALPKRECTLVAMRESTTVCIKVLDELDRLVGWLKNLLSLDE